MPAEVKTDATPTAETTPAAETETQTAVETVADTGKPSADEVSAFRKGLEDEGLLPDAVEVDEDADEPVVAADDATPAADAKPDAPAVDSEKAKVDEQIADINKALKEGGSNPLSKKSEEHFRKLAARPTPEAVEAIVAPLRAQAAVAQSWSNVIEETGATKQQVEASFGIIKALNSKDPAQMSQAADALFSEVKNLFTQLGRELPGVVDPLAEHKDLIDEIDNGDLTRARALEIARDRAMKKRGEEFQASNSSRQEFDNALKQATNDLGALATQLKGMDPQFSAKLPYLQPILDEIKVSVHPSKWTEKVRAAYMKIPNIPTAPAPAAAAPVARAPITAQPMRATGSGAAVVQTRKFSKQEVESGAPFAAGMKQARA
jgi:hypothetical protein